MTAPTSIVAPADAARLVAGVLDELERAVVGKRPVLELVLLGLIADGHVLLDDLPGVAKTLTARSLARVTEDRPGTEGELAAGGVEHGGAGDVSRE